MANSVKRLYEGMFIVDSAIATANWDEAHDAVKSILDRGNAEILNIRKWDDRRLCYEIKGRRRGTYILSYFRADASVITGMERDVQLSESILRTLILRADHISSDEEKAQEQMNCATPFDLGAAEEAAAAEQSEDSPAVAVTAVAVEDAEADQAQDEAAVETTQEVAEDTAVESEEVKEEDENA